MTWKYGKNKKKEALNWLKEELKEERRKYKYTLLTESQR